MRRSDLAYLISKQLPNMPIQELHAAVNTLTNYIRSQMVEGYKIECRGFGHLERRKRPPRCIHHPQKQNVFLEYPGRYAAYFRPGKALREALQKAAAANIPIQVEQEEDFFQLDDENN